MEEVEKQLNTVQKSGFSVMYLNLMKILKTK